MVDIYYEVDRKENSKFYDNLNIQEMMGSEIIEKSQYYTEKLCMDQ